MSVLKLLFLLLPPPPVTICDDNPWILYSSFPSSFAFPFAFVLSMDLCIQ